MVGLIEGLRKLPTMEETRAQHVAQVIEAMRAEAKINPAVKVAAAMVAAPVVKSTRTVRFSLWASVAIIPITWTR